MTRKKVEYPSSVQVFLYRLMDYAGLFPPANLSLMQAIQNYRQYVNEQDEWMLSRFIIPIQRVGELTSYLSYFSEQQPLRLAVTGQRANTEEESLALLHEHLPSCFDYVKRSQGVLKLEVLEQPLPPVVPSQAYLQKLALLSCTDKINLFCEPTFPFGPTWEKDFTDTVAALAKTNKKAKKELGLKFRMGGVNKADFPSVEQVSSVLLLAKQFQMPQKFTAGLHHPVRMYRDEVATNMHGFLNVFIGSLLVRKFALTSLELEQIIADENPAHFVFEQDQVSWRGYSLTMEEMKVLRERDIFSFGTCSFDEPRMDLRDIEIL